MPLHFKSLKISFYFNSHNWPKLQYKDAEKNSVQSS